MPLCEHKPLVPPESAVEVRFICAAEMPFVAELFKRTFPQNPMLSWPPELLSNYFSCQIHDALDLVALGAWSQEQFVGFCIGATKYMNRHEFSHKHAEELSRDTRRTPKSIVIALRRRLRRIVRWTCPGFIIAREQGVPASSQTTSNSYHMIWLAVDPDLHGRGVGKKLVVEMEKQVADKGFTSIHLSVDSHNTSAIGLYKSLGWGVVERVGHKLRMQKVLRSTF